MNLTNVSRDLSTRYDKWFDSFFNDLDNQFGRMIDFNNLKWSNGYPRVDISETGTELKVEASVTGLTKDDVSVEYADNLLTISGEKQERKGNYTRRELHRSSFSRSFSLPSQLYDVDSIKCVLENGLLTVTVKKLEQPKEEVRRIPVM